MELVETNKNGVIHYQKSSIPKELFLSFYNDVPDLTKSLVGP